MHYVHMILKATEKNTTTKKNHLSIFTQNFSIISVINIYYLSKEMLITFNKFAFSI